MVGFKNHETLLLFPWALPGPLPNPHLSTHTRLLVAIRPRLHPSLDLILSGRAAKSSPFQKHHLDTAEPLKLKVRRGRGPLNDVRPIPTPPFTALHSSFIPVGLHDCVPSESTTDTISSVANSFLCLCIFHRNLFSYQQPLPRASLRAKSLHRIVDIEALMASLVDHAGALFSRHADQAGALLAKRAHYCSDGTYRRCCSRWDCFGRWIFAAVAVFACFFIFFLWA